jgi:hypothetical protein
MHPAAVVEKDPERILLQPAQIGDHRGGDRFDALLVQGAGEVVMIGDIGAVVGAEHDRNHVAGEEGAGLVAVLLFPVQALGLDLAHADGDLRRPQIRKRGRVEDRVANHRAPP